MTLGRTSKLARWVLTLGAGSAVAFGTAMAQQANQQSAPDNTRTNRARSESPSQQKETASDRATTQQIRKAIVNDKSLSMYAHNVKVVTQNGHVTLAGTVRSDEEKSTVEAKAAEIAGASNITNQLEVAPSK
jgi:hyperosmotically inducible periplasmic protein